MMLHPLYSQMRLLQRGRRMLRRDRGADRGRTDGTIRRLENHYRTLRAACNRSERRIRQVAIRVGASSHSGSYCYTYPESDKYLHTSCAYWACPAIHLHTPNAKCTTPSELVRTYHAMACET